MPLLAPGSSEARWRDHADAVRAQPDGAAHPYSRPQIAAFLRFLNLLDTQRLRVDHNLLRFVILDLLLEDEARGSSKVWAISTMAGVLGQPVNSVSRHIKALEAAGYVWTREDLIGRCQVIPTDWLVARVLERGAMGARIRGLLEAADAIRAAGEAASKMEVEPLRGVVASR